MSNGPLANIARIVDARSKRISSYDRTGGNDDFTGIGPGGTLTLAEMKGAGIVKHIWVTISTKDPLFRRNLVLRMYWDGQDHPSVEAPIGWSCTRAPAISLRPGRRLTAPSPGIQRRLL